MIQIHAMRIPGVEKFRGPPLSGGISTLRKEDPLGSNPRIPRFLPRGWGASLLPTKRGAHRGCGRAAAAAVTPDAEVLVI